MIKYILPKPCHLPGIRTAPGIPPTGCEANLVPGFMDPGSVLILGQVTEYGESYLICITQNSKTTFAFKVPVHNYYHTQYALKIT